MQLQALSSLVHHSVGLLLIPTARAVDFISSYLFSSIIYAQTHCPTHKHMQFLLRQYTHSTMQVSGVECLFLRSAEVQNGQVSATNDCTGETLCCNIPPFNYIVTVLTAYTTQINKICTPRNLFPMVRVAYILKVKCNW